MITVNRSIKLKVATGLLAGLMAGTAIMPMAAQAQQRRRGRPPGRPGIGNQSDSTGFNPRGNGNAYGKGGRFRFFTRNTGRQKGQKLKKTAALMLDNGSRLASVFSNNAVAALPQNSLIHLASFDAQLTQVAEVTSPEAKYVGQDELNTLQAAVRLVSLDTSSVADSLTKLSADEDSARVKIDYNALNATVKSTNQLQAALPVLFARVNALPKDGTPEQARALSAMFNTLSDLTTDVQVVADGLKNL